MATLGELPSSTASPLPNFNTSYDTEFDSFLNLDQAVYPTSESMKSNPSLLSQPTMAASEASISEMGQSFSGPSHQYGDHPQQTGFPPDAVAHAMAYNDNSLGALHTGHHQSFSMGDGNMLRMKREESAVDFGSALPRGHSEMDIENDNGNNKAYFMTPTGTVKTQQFIDPNAMGGQEIPLMSHPAPQAGRVYPGMHQQQAAMARAAQQQKIRQRQAEQFSRQTPNQPPLPLARHVRQPDPVVEERISRLLQQMRQNGPNQDNRLSTPTLSALPQMAKLKKDEDNMDDDERLLASEEGKKLSSKERRQLRNKVSARAFRSRRKEYITQLEGEVSAKTSENNELRLKNHALAEENLRLNDLTRLLLSSPHFSDVLNDLSANGIPAQLQTSPQTAQPQSQPQSVVSQASIPSGAANPQQNMQGNMAMVPDNHMDIYSAGWNSGIDMNYANANANANVFAVLEVPEGPAVDIEVLSGKSSNFIETSSESSKIEIPSLERPPFSTSPATESMKAVSDPTNELDESDPSFALFLEDMHSNSTTDSTVPFDGCQSEKSSQYKLVVEQASGDVSVATVRTFERLCSSMDAVFDRMPFLVLRQEFVIEAFLPPATLASPQGLGRVAFRGTSPRTLHPAIWTSVNALLFKNCFAFNCTYRGRRHLSVRPKSRQIFKGPLAVNQPALPDLRLIPEYSEHRRQNSIPAHYLLLDPELKNREPKSGEPERGTERESSSAFPKKPMKYWYQVLSTPTADSPGSTIILNYPDHKYVFGHISEGTQRVIIESGASITHLSDFFVTGRTTWANLGGTLGMLLTIADSRTSAVGGMEAEMQKKAARNDSAARTEDVDNLEQEFYTGLTIHGGRNVNHMLATARRFIFRKSVPISVKEYDSASLASEQEASGQADPFENPTYSDDNIKVLPMSLKPSYEIQFESRAGFRSPRKRSWDEMEEKKNDGRTSLDSKATDQLVREHIVKAMFNSDWKLDRLFEENLRKVDMPGTVFVRNPDTGDLEKYTGPLLGGPDPVPDIKVFVRKPWPAAEIKMLPATSPSSESLCYFVRSRDLRGKFDPSKAVALGVPKGPAFAQLASGQNYTTKDGTVVTPDMVLGPTRAGKSVAFIDIPSTLYISDLISRPEWKSPVLTDSLSTIFWILGPGVGQDPRLVEFVSRMKTCEHVVSSPDHCPNRLTMLTAARSALRLAKLNSDNFVVPVHDNTVLPQSGAHDEIPKQHVASISSTQKLPWKASQPGLTLDMEPKFGFDESTVIPALDTHSFVAHVPKAVQQRLKAIRKRLRSHSVIDKVMEMRLGLPPFALESEVITLGTGSSSPSKYRNVSATLLNVPGKGYYLLDCGENTLGQLKRVFNPAELREVMRNLRMIWISHLHADHHLGAVSVIKEWYEVNYGREDLSERPDPASVTEDMVEILKQKRLCVISEANFIQWLEEYAEVENFGFDKLLPLSAHSSSKIEKHTIFSFRHTKPDGTPEDQDRKITSIRFDNDSSYLTKLLRKATGLKDVRTVWVNHCRGAMAVTLEWEGGFKVSYSGDCRPSQDFARIGKNSTLLIHEATFQDDLGGQALAKRHSTTTEAIQVGRKMNARMMLLTHFSQRYAKISKFGHNDKTFQMLPSTDARAEYIQRIGAADIPDDNDDGDGVSEGDWPGDGGMDVPNNDDLDIGTLMVTDSQDQTRRSPMPICMAFDYMKVKVSDIPIAQMFTPAFEKLIERLERASEEESLELREKQLAAMQAKNPKGSKKSGNKEKKNSNSKKGGDSEQKSPVRSAAPTPTPSGHRKKSAWSASESESGWSDGNDSDTDNVDKRNIAL